MPCLEGRAAPVCSEGLRPGREGGWGCLLGRLGAAGRQSAQDQGEPALSPVLPSWQNAISEGIGPSGRLRGQGNAGSPAPSPALPSSLSIPPCPARCPPLLAAAWGLCSHLQAAVPGRELPVWQVACCGPAGHLTRGVPVVGSQWILHPGGRAAVWSGTGLGCGRSLQHQISLASHRLLEGARGQRPEPSLGAGCSHLLTKRKPTAHPVPSGHARNSPRDAIF